MAYAIDPNEEFEYVLKAEREAPSDERTVFLLRRLTRRQRSAIEDKSLAVDRATNQIVSPTGAIKELILRAGLKGWRNYRRRGPRMDGPADEPPRFAPGVEIEFKAEKVAVLVLGESCNPPTAATLEQLNPLHENELCNVITAGLDDDDRKN